MDIGLSIEKENTYKEYKAQKKKGKWKKLARGQQRKRKRKGLSEQYSGCKANSMGR